MAEVSAAVIVAVICKRRKRKRKAREVWEREWLRRRTERGVYRQLLEELRLEDEESYRKYLRMDTETFQVRLNGFPSCKHATVGVLALFLNCVSRLQKQTFKEKRNIFYKCEDFFPAIFYPCSFCSLRLLFTRSITPVQILVLMNIRNCELT